MQKKLKTMLLHGETAKQIINVKSMYPKLWEASGIPLKKLIDRLIGLAIERHERDQKLKVTYR